MDRIQDLLMLGNLILSSITPLFSPLEGGTVGAGACPHTPWQYRVSFQVFQAYFLQKGFYLEAFKIHRRKLSFEARWFFD
jgi:hypothetical protein